MLSSYANLSDRPRAGPSSTAFCSSNSEGMPASFKRTTRLGPLLPGRLLVPHSIFALGNIDSARELPEGREGCVSGYNPPGAKPRGSSAADFAGAPSVAIHQRLWDDVQGLFV